jgi:hypothetical protein
MKLEEIARPGVVMFGVAGLAAGALLGFAAGVAVMRDPEAARRAAARAARLASQGFEQATLLAAQAREQLGDIWAEAEAAVAHARTTADEADFAREAASAASATAAAAVTSATAAAPAAGSARRRGKQRSEQLGEQGDEQGGEERDEQGGEQHSTSAKRAARAASPRKRTPRRPAAARRGEAPAGGEASTAE